MLRRPSCALSRTAAALLRLSSAVSRQYRAHPAWGRALFSHVGSDFRSCALTRSATRSLRAPARARPNVVLARDARGARPLRRFRAEQVRRKTMNNMKMYVCVHMCPLVATSRSALFPPEGEILRETRRARREPPCGCSLCASPGHEVAQHEAADSVGAVAAKVPDMNGSHFLSSRPANLDRYSGVIASPLLTSILDVDIIFASSLHGRDLLVGTESANELDIFGARLFNQFGVE